MIAPFTASSVALAWSPDAEARLERVPPFIRRFERRRAEEFVREAGESLVTPAHLETLARRRFGEAGPPKGFAGMGPKGFSDPKGGNET